MIPVRLILTFSAFSLLIFGIFAWFTDFEINGSSLLPLLLSTGISNLLYLIYRSSYRNADPESQSRLITIMGKIGFEGNMVLFICLLLYMIGYSLILFTSS